MISGIIAGLAASKYVSDTLTTLSTINKASKFVQKVVYPIGIFAISSTVGTMACKEVNGQVQELKDKVNGFKETGKAMRELKEQFKEPVGTDEPVPKEPTTYSVFDGAVSVKEEEVDENGES